MTRGDPPEPGPTREDNRTLHPAGDRVVRDQHGRPGTGDSDPDTRPEPATLDEDADAPSVPAIVGKILRHLPGAAPARTEADVEGDSARVDSRATGGDPDRRPTEGGTTGTTVAEDFVGRVAGDDDFSGPTGAEVRARRH